MDPLETISARCLINSEHCISSLRLKLQELRQMIMEQVPTDKGNPQVHVTNTVTDHEFHIN